jgi:hypothetical protein
VARGGKWSELLAPLAGVITRCTIAPGFRGGQEGTLRYQPVARQVPPQQAGDGEAGMVRSPCPSGSGGQECPGGRNRAGVQPASLPRAISESFFPILDASSHPDEMPRESVSPHHINAVSHRPGSGRLAAGRSP